MRLPRNAQKKPQMSMTVSSPVQMPRMRGRHFRKPYCPVEESRSTLFGPGEKVVAQAYAASERKIDKCIIKLL